MPWSPAARNVADMPRIPVNGITLHYERAGDGEPVLFVMGSGASSRVWTMHQTPALVRAGYQCITFDNRGMPPSDVPEGRYSLSSMVADTVGLIESLGLAPCRIVATSLGAMITQELAASRPDLVRCAALIATRARADPMRTAMIEAERAIAEQGIRLPPVYDAAVQVVNMLSAATRNNPAAVSTWLELFEMAAGQNATSEGQLWALTTDDHRDVLRDVVAPCRVISFAEDLITPPHLGAEVAELIPKCDVVELTDCGHLGFLERPDEVNAAILEFLDRN
jgi:pimeloyl-ACP methyl ester carboxylesterase